MPGALAGIFLLIQKTKIIDILSCNTKKVKHRIEDLCCRLKICFIVTYLLYALVYYTYIVAVYLVVGAIWLALSVVLAAVWYAVLLIPSLVSFCVVVYQKQKVWGQR